MSLSTLPTAPVDEVIHGVVVHDPYRWLEDRNLPETEEWIAEQQKRCQQYFAECGNLDVLRSRVREYLDVEVVDQPARVAGRNFYRKRNRGQEQASIYVQDIATGQERLLVDPSEQGQYVSAGIHRISEDGSLLAYEIKHGGEDRKAIHIVDVETGFVLTDRLETGYARGFAFSADKAGFYYCHEISTASEDHTIRLHRIQEPGADQMVFRVPRTRGSRLVLTADDVHLGAVWIHQGSSELLADFFITQRDEPSSWKHVFADRTLPYSPILKYGRIFALSHDDAPNGKLVELNDDGCEIGTIIPEQDGTIRQLFIAGERVFVSYLRHMIPSLQCWTLSGNALGQIDIPIDGTIQLLANQGAPENSLFYTYESFAEPLAIFEYLPETGKSLPWHRRPLPVTFTSCHMRRVSVPSKDGTQIPMVLIARHRNEEGLESPVIMTGYGGFGVSMTPQFSVLASVMMEFGVTFALPQIRGGGEFGKEWHDAARGRNRQVAFDDFIAAAEWLCAKGETAPEKLAIFGGSNSGLLVAAAMTQHPERFRAVLCIAPILDMVRYEQFDQAIKWRREYGAVENAEDFNVLYSYSPYHRIEDFVGYPATLFVSGDKDDRCNPAHVRKMAERLQQRDAQTNPVLVDYSFERGHSPVLPLSVRTDALVRRIAFLCRELNILSVVGDFHEMPCP
jgi:prolyl oligopeptidase